MTGDRNISIGSGNYKERIEGDYIQGNYYNAPQKQNLAQAAEIQELLEQLDRNYDTGTTSGKMQVALVANSSVLGCNAETAGKYGEIKHNLRLKGRPLPEKISGLQQ